MPAVKKKVSQNTILHQLVNRERLEYGLWWAKWDQQLYIWCKEQSNLMARKGKVFHTDIELVGIAECVIGGEGDIPPSALFKGLINSEGHRNLLLSDIDYAAVAISHSPKGTFATWQGRRE